MRPWLRGQGFLSAQELRKRPSGNLIAIAGEVIIVHTPPMRDGRRVIFITLEDETGLMDLAIFPDKQAGNSQAALGSPIILVWGQLSRRGVKDAMVVVNRVRPAPVRLPGRAKAAPRGE